MKVRFISIPCVCALLWMFCGTSGGQDVKAAVRHPSVGLMVEMVQMKTPLSLSLLREYGDNSDEARLRKRVDDLIETGEAALEECAFVRLDRETGASLISADEVRSGLIGDPPELPMTVTVKGENKGIIAPTPPAYTSFEVRDAGLIWRPVVILETQKIPILDKNVDENDEEGDPFFADTSAEFPKELSGVEAAPGAKVILLGGTLDWTEFLFRDYAAPRPADPAENPEAYKWHPRFRVSAIRDEIRLVPGGTSLIATWETGPSDKKAKLLVFLTAWLLE